MRAWQVSLQQTPGGSEQFQGMGRRL